MNFNFTPDALSKILKNNQEIDLWFDICNQVFPKYNISTAKRAAAFFAQCGHESRNFTALTENLNYSAQGLANTWPSKYAIKDSAGQVQKPVKPNDLALSLHRQPENIANYTYANMLGNGDLASGDGFKYRGRGIIQLTGKQNYQSFASSLGLSLDAAVAFCETKEGAMTSACWFWTNKKLNSLADVLPDGLITQRDFVAMTKKINGGTMGLEDRTSMYNRAITALGE